MMMMSFLRRVFHALSTAMDPDLDYYDQRLKALKPGQTFQNKVDRLNRRTRGERFDEHHPG